MDCPSEERLIRMKLDTIQGIVHLDFDIPNRQLTVYHQSTEAEVTRAIEGLKLGGRLIQTEVSDEVDFEEHSHQRKLLWTVLAINFAFFLIEMTTGLLSRSMGLVADSLDMLADAFVYGISIMAVGAAVAKKKRVARWAGYFQIVLAAMGFVEVLRRFMGQEGMPDFMTMIVVSVLALIANAFCLYILQQSGSKEEAHMQASLIFTSNDVIINLGVITAGVLVYYTHSGIPDLIIGTIVFLIVMRGALRILKLGR